MSDTHQIPVWFVECAFNYGTDESPIWLPDISPCEGWNEALGMAKDMRKNRFYECVRVTGPHYMTVPGKEKIHADLL